MSRLPVLGDNLLTLLRKDNLFEHIKESTIRAKSFRELLKGVDDHGYAAGRDAAKISNPAVAGRTVEVTNTGILRVDMAAKGYEDGSQKIEFVYRDLLDALAASMASPQAR